MINERKIYCKGCRLYLGIIRDAKLRKDIIFLCKSCEIKRVASDLMNKSKPKDPYDDFMDIFTKGK